MSSNLSSSLPITSKSAPIPMTRDRSYSEPYLVGTPSNFFFSENQKSFHFPLSMPKEIARLSNKEKISEERIAAAEKRVEEMSSQIFVSSYRTYSEGSKEIEIAKGEISKAKEILNLKQQASLKGEE